MYDFLLVFHSNYASFHRYSEILVRIANLSYSTCITPRRG